MNEGKAQVGHPVDVVTGTLFTARNDIEIPGAISLVWRAFYSTALLGGKPSVMGPGWTHSFDLTLTIDLDGFRFQGEDGLVIGLDDPENSVGNGELLRDISSCIELKLRGDLYELLHWHPGSESVIKYLFRASPPGIPMRLTAFEDLSGNRIDVEYDGNGRPVGARQTLEGRQLSMEYDERGRLFRVLLDSPVSDHSEEVVRYEYDRQGRMIAAVDDTGQPVCYAYDKENRLVSETNRTGGTYHMRYDAKGRCIETGGDNDYKRVGLEYSPLEQLTRVTNSFGYVTSYFYNHQGLIENIILANGATFTTIFDDYGRVVARMDPLKRQHRYAYNREGDRVEETSPTGAVTLLEYNGFHLPIKITDPDGAVSQFQYDDHGKLVSMRNAMGNATLYSRTGKGVLTRIVKPSGDAVSIRRDAGWTEQVITNRYGSRRFRLNARLTICETIDAGGNRTLYEWHSSGRVKKVTKPDEAVYHFLRDGRGNLFRFQDNYGGEKSFHYSPYGELLETTDQMGRTTKWNWDSEGRLRQIHDPEGRVCGFAYDMAGNVIEKSFFDDRIESYEYDVAGQLTRRILPGGSSVGYEYDAAGYRIKELYDDGTTLERTFDVIQQLTSAACKESVVAFEYDLCGNRTAEIQDGVRMEYRYDADRELIGQAFGKSQTGPLSFRWDSRGQRVIGIGDRISEVWKYDKNGLLKEREMAHAVERFAYDPSQRIIEQRVEKTDKPHWALNCSAPSYWKRDAGKKKREFFPKELPGAVHHILSLREFDYDQGDNIVHVSDGIRGDTTYGYDEIQQLKSSERPLLGKIDYGYDLSGNLTRRGEEEHLSYGPGNRCMESGNVRYKYDEQARVVASIQNGERTEYVWDALSRLIGVLHPDGSETAFGYDALDRRIFKESGGKRTLFYWSGNDLIAEEKEEDFREYFVWNSQPYMVFKDGSTHHVINSHQRLPHELIDDKGGLAWKGSYDDWGSLIEDSDPALSLPFRFPGQYADTETGFHYNRMRYYNPSTGNFLSPDPQGTLAGLNEFLYAPNPVNWFDPLGLACNRTGCADAQQRVRERTERVKGVMSDWEKKNHAISVSEVLTGDGSIEVRVSQAGTSRPRVKRTILDAARLDPNEVVTTSYHPEGTSNATRVNDAERHTLRGLNQELPLFQNETLLATGATRDVCPTCQAAYNDANLGDAFATPLE
ncbi:DUF6531 domain-containing protein [bacterium]|nr:DUF6531 domain-containing protein [bacterium]